MSNSIFFWNKWGGANNSPTTFKQLSKPLVHFALITVALFTTILPVWAQPPAFAIDCSGSSTNLYVEIVPISTPMCGVDECNRHYFQVRLVTQLSITGNPASFLLKYQKVGLTIKVVTDPAGGLSTVDSIQTTGCYPSGFDDFPLGIEHDNEVTFLVEGDCNSSTTPNILFNSDDVAPPYGPPYTADLFVIAVVGVPGEDVLFEITQSTYECPDFSYYCYDELQLDSDAFEVPAPMGNEGQVCLEFDDYDPGTDLLPVMATNSNGTAIEAEYLSCTILIDADNPIDKPKLDNFVQAPVAYSVDPVPGTDDWRVYVRFENSTGITVPGSGDIKLFDIEIKGPVNESLETNVEVCLTEGQIRRSGFTCRNACLSMGCEEIEFVGETACDPDIFTVVVSAEEPGVTCSELEVRVQLNWCCGPSSPEDFNQIRIAVEFDLPPGVTIDDIGTNTFGCPSNTDCNMSGFNDCFLIDGNRVTFCFLPTTPEAVNLGSYFTVLFNATENCVNGATVREALVEMDGEALCVPTTVIETEDFPLCSPLLVGWVKNPNGQYIDDVDVVISLIPPDMGCPPESIWPNNASWSWCPCDVGPFRVKPQVRYGGAAWRNGVTIFDVARIYRHLNDVEPFTTIYQYAAADTDDSGTIQTGAPAPDVIEIRDLILGNNSTFPENNSWRYFYASSPGILPAMNPYDPFTLPDEQWFDVPSDPDINFVAVKIGDVNNSHNTDLELRPAGTLALLTESLPRMPKGGYVSIPVRYEGTVPLIALQMGFRFDADLWEYVGITASDLQQVSEGSFNLSNSANGEIKFAWFGTQPEEYARPGQTMFFLTFRAKSVTRGDMNPLQIDDGLLRSVAYTPEGATYNLSMGAEAGLRDLVAPTKQALDVVCSPNPASGAVSLSITTATEASSATVWAYGAFGNRILRREIPLTGRTTSFQFPESADWPAGLYVWKVKVGDAKTEGRLLKQ